MIQTKAERQAVCQVQEFPPSYPTRIDVKGYKLIDPVKWEECFLLDC